MSDVSRDARVGKGQPVSWSLRLQGTMPNGVRMYWLNERTSIGTAYKPDADLAAAAPDLLEALANLKPILDRAESNASGNLEWYDVSARVNAARAALAKALGK